MSIFVNQADLPDHVRSPDGFQGLTSVVLAPTREPEGGSRVGTLAKVVRLSRLPGPQCRMLLECQLRVKYQPIPVTIDPAGSRAKLELVHLRPFPTPDNLPSSLSDRLTRLIKTGAQGHARLLPIYQTEIKETLSQEFNLEGLVDRLAALLPLPSESKWAILCSESLQTRCESLLEYFSQSEQAEKIEKSIKGRIKAQVEKNQREYLLQEQLKAIQKELGKGAEVEKEIASLENRIEAAKLTGEAKEAAEHELSKLKTLSLYSSESGVIRSYLDWLLKFPWRRQSTPRKLDLKQAQVRLDSTHYGLKRVKDRILGYLAVQIRKKSKNGEVLCLIGPPGTGKSSIVRSVAEALGKKFGRIALGGLRDEAELRGHRRTYVSALPGRFFQELCRTGQRDCVLLLDEVDKLSHDLRGDPASVLLEALDPQQNSAFQDHYLGLGIDLSSVLFVATANDYTFPKPLRDRMDFIEVSGYSEEEKQEILSRHLIPKQTKKHGLYRDECLLSPMAQESLVVEYTREAGLRDLERKLARIYREVVKGNVLKGGDAPDPTRIDSEDVPHYLGPKPYPRASRSKACEALLGRVNGLAWTEVGGERLLIESILLPGKGRLKGTGSLGRVMQESLETAASLARRYASYAGLNWEFFSKHDLHLHVPSGATPKEGPSAGTAILLALLSSLLHEPIAAAWGFTGEVSLSGKILRIGGLKEKLLAARREGLTRVFLPQKNRDDLEDVPVSVLKDLEVTWVNETDQLVAMVLPNLVLPSKLPPTNGLGLSST